VTTTSFPVTLRSNDDAEDTVTTVELDEINVGWVASIFIIFNGISSILLLPLIFPVRIAFSAQSFASFNEKHTPAVLNTSIFDATFLSDGAVHTGGAFTRPGPSGVNVPGSGVSSRPSMVGLFAALLCVRVGTGEMLEVTGGIVFDSSPEVGMGPRRKDLIS